MVTTVEETLLVERRGSALWLTLSRVGKANAMTVGMMEGLAAAITEAASDPAVSAILLTGAGERLFCAGVDVREKPADGDMVRQRSRRAHALAAVQDAIMDVPKPFLVVLNGMAIGAGAMLALLADACIAAEEAEIALPEIDIGIPTFSGASILEAIGGRALALDLIQSGRRMPAKEAVARGVLRAAVPRETLGDSAAALAGALSSKDRGAFAENKRWINRTLRAAIAEARQEHARHRAVVAG